jgi:hypothetical protein
MPLSENERRQLQQIEHDLLAQDPRLASSFGGRRWRRTSKTVLASSGVLCGIVLMFTGLRVGGALGIVIADAGFLVLVLATASLGGFLQNRLRARRRTAEPASGAKDRPE